MSTGKGSAQKKEASATKAATKLYNTQAKIGQEQWAWSKANTMPAMERLLADADSFDSPERQQMAAGMAQADVGRSFGISRAAQHRDMMRMGVNPASGRFQGMNNVSNIQEALGRAGAGTAARRAVEDGGFARRTGAASLASGQGMQALSGIGQAGAGFANLAAMAGDRASGIGAGLGHLAGIGILSAANYDW